ncbi:MAG TPA: glycosyltransferase family 4 protein [Gemmatimonadales bacterium]
MKILYVTQRLPFGHGETFIVPELEALLARGHELLIVPQLSDDPILHDDVGPIMARTRMLPGAGRIAGAVLRSLLRQPGRTLGAFWRLRRTRLLRRMIANAIATAQGIWLGDLARSWGAEHIHAHWAHLTATMAMGASTVSGIPWSFTAHRYDVVLNNLLSDKLRSAGFGRFIGRHMLEVARSLVGPDAIARAMVLHMGVALPPLRDHDVRAPRVPVVLCPASLVPVKGQRYLLDAAASLAARGTTFELWLAGEGPEESDLTRRIRDLGLGDRVRLLGLVPHAELLQLYAQREVDCVVLPSLDLGNGKHEGISVALVEAMAYGVPVVSTATGGLTELLEDGAGVLVPPANRDALADALARVLGSAELRTQLGRAGRRRIEQDFDVTLVAGELVRRFASARQA